MAVEKKISTLSKILNAHFPFLHSVPLRSTKIVTPPLLFGLLSELSAKNFCIKFLCDFFLFPVIVIALGQWIYEYKEQENYSVSLLETENLS
jgi:hypothetical protein